MKISTLLFTLLLGGTTSVFSQEAQPLQNEPKVQTRLKVVPLGHYRLVTWAKSKKDEVFQTSGSPDEKGEEFIRRKGTLVEVRGKEFEYLPGNIFIEGYENEKTGNLQPIKLYLNTVASEVVIPGRAKLDIKIKDGLQKPNEKAKYKSWVSHTNANVATDQLAIVIANPADLESWKNPTLRTFDISEKSLPAGAMLFFNGTPFRVELQIPLKDTEEPVIIAPYSAKRLKPGVVASGRTRVIAKLLSNDGQSKRQFYYNSVKIPENGRSFMMTYFDPKKETPIPAGVVQFTDELPAPKK